MREEGGRKGGGAADGEGDGYLVAISCSPNKDTLRCSTDKPRAAKPAPAHREWEEGAVAVARR